jgi:UDP-glucose 4-epimerase
MQKVLITGGAGFIGNNLARYLLKGGCEVVAVDDLSLGVSANLPPDVRLIVGDIADERVWKDVPAVDAIVHLAGASSAPMFQHGLSGCFQNNVVGFTQLLEFAHATGVSRVVYASTSSVYGNVEPPLREDGDLDIPNFYAVSKYCMEQIARMAQLQWGLDVVGLRFMSVYGPREDHKGRYANLISQFIWDIEAGRAPVVYGDGGQTRDFTNVADVAQAITRVLRHPSALRDSIFNVGGEGETSINQLLALLSEKMGVTIHPNYIPNPVERGYVLQQRASLDKIRRTLGYEPVVSLEDGVEEIVSRRRDSKAAPALVGMAS